MVRVTRLSRSGSLVTAVGLLVASALPVGAADSAAGFTATPISGGSTIAGDLSKAATKDGMSAVIVKLDDDSVAAYRGGRPGIPATSPAARGAKSIDFNAAATLHYRAFLSRKQGAFATRLATKAPRARITHHYDLVLNAVAAVVPSDKVPAVAALPGVEAVYPDQLLKLDTDRSPQFIGAPTAWTALGGQESAGEGIIVGVLDSGVWPEHPSFSDPDPSGKPYAPPPAAPDGSRACQFSGGANPGPAFTCNNKLIGAARFMDTYDAVVGLAPGEFTTARDDNGHGTHTSSTAAGDAGVPASIFGVQRGTISGIAPRAQVEMFRVCGDQGCFQSDSVAAVQAAIGDGVDVINFSIAGGANAFADPVELAFLDAYNAGVFVSASAGNSGPGADTTDHRGPWTMTVGASTTDRAFVDALTLNGAGGASLSLAGVSLTAGIGPAPVAIAPDMLCGPMAAGSLTGMIAICARGVYGRAEEGKNVFNAGGVGMILYNQSAAVTDRETDNHFLPTSHIRFGQGQQVLAFLAANPGATATIGAGVKGSQQGDVMASFSSRGGSAQVLGVSKPDITAPGVQILAGQSPQHVDVDSGPQGELFQASTGTSMSSPHIAGAAALIEALHPTWTPGQIKSALMTTARRAGVVKEDGVTPADAFDDGSGRVDLTVAGRPGLTFDATGAQFLAAADHLYTANYPSVFIPSMPGRVTVRRTARNTQSVPVTWQLSATGTADMHITVPSQVTPGAGASTTFGITIDAGAVPLGQTRFGMVTLRETRGGSRVLHMPVTIVRGQASITFTKACAPTSLRGGQRMSCTLTASNPTFNDATYRIRDRLPSKLDLIRSSVVGGSVLGDDTVVASGVLPASQPANVTLAPGSSPAGGYLPLSLFGVPPITGVGDDTITNFDVAAFTYAGETLTRLGVGSNGYLVVGGGSGPDVSINNQNFPDASPPNNVLAAFWTDLNPGAAGAVRISTLTDGSDTWIVVDWDAVREFSQPRLASFEIWIGLNGDANPGEDISYAYGPIQGNGDGGFLSVGVENKFGNRGNNTYFNGTGTLPADGSQLQVTSTPQTSSSVSVSFNARAGADRGRWTNCATLASSAFIGTSVSCIDGTVSR